jgi:hypothetical protein
VAADEVPQQDCQQQQHEHGRTRSGKSVMREMRSVYWVSVAAEQIQD